MHEVLRKCFSLFKMAPLERNKVLALVTKIIRERKRRFSVQRAILFIIAQRRNLLFNVSSLLAELLTSLRESGESEPIPLRACRRLSRNGGWWELVWST